VDDPADPLCPCGKGDRRHRSFGVACAPHHGKGVEELLKHADEALYLSKQYGATGDGLYPG